MKCCQSSRKYTEISLTKYKDKLTLKAALCIGNSTSRSPQDSPSAQSPLLQFAAWELGLLLEKNGCNTTHTVIRIIRNFLETGQTFFLAIDSMIRFQCVCAFSRNLCDQILFCIDYI